MHLAAYDISHSRRLRLALKVAKNYATGGQKSVFECFLTARERGRFSREMEDVIDAALDRFLLLRLEARSPVITLGIAVPPEDPEFYYVG